jgi:hypothetical protein
MTKKPGDTPEPLKRITFTPSPALYEMLRNASFELRRTKQDLICDALLKTYAKYATTQ